MNIIDTKTFREKIRKCNNSKELYDLLKTLSDNYIFMLKRKSNLWILADIFINYNDEKIICYFPYMWKQSFKNSKIFSYNIHIKSKDFRDNVGIHLEN